MDIYFIALVGLLVSNDFRFIPLGLSLSGMFYAWGVTMHASKFCERGLHLVESYCGNSVTGSRVGHLSSCKFHA